MVVKRKIDLFNVTICSSAPEIFSEFKDFTNGLAEYIHSLYSGYTSRSMGICVGLMPSTISILANHNCSFWTSLRELKP